MSEKRGTWKEKKFIEIVETAPLRFSWKCWYKILLLDVDKTFNISINKLKTLAQKENLAGLIGVNLLGVPAENEELRNFCDDKNIFYFEDNCESFGASLNNRFWCKKSWKV